jgi:hypothetical protein
MLDCTNMCTLATSTLRFSAQICVLRPLKVKELLDLICLKVSRVRCYIFSETNTLQFVPLVIDTVRHAKQH